MLIAIQETQLGKDTPSLLTGDLTSRRSGVYGLARMIAKGRGGGEILSGDRGRAKTRSISRHFARNTITGGAVFKLHSE